MSDDLVTIDITGGIADVRLNLPDKYNALSPDMFKAIVDAGETLLEANDVRAVVLSGNGRGFCAGLDMPSFAGMADAAESGSDAPTGALLARDERPENFALEASLQTGLIGSPNQVEAIKANLENRRPDFA